MSKNQLVIKRAFLATPTGNIDSSYRFDGVTYSQKLSVEFNVVREITAVVVSQYQEVIDIETGEVFPTVERDELDRIKNLNIQNLDPNILVALRFLDKEWGNMSLVEQLKLKSNAKKVYEMYVEEKQKDKKGSALTKKKRK